MSSVSDYYTAGGKFISHSACGQYKKQARHGQMQPNTYATVAPTKAPAKGRAMSPTKAPVKGRAMSPTKAPTKCANGGCEKFSSRRKVVNETDTGAVLFPKPEPAVKDAPTINL